MANVTCKLDDIKYASGKIKAAGLQSRFLVVSTLIYVAYEDGVLSLSATDVDNLVKVDITADCEDLGKQECYVDLNTFCGLIERFDKNDKVTLEFGADGLTVQNGTGKGGFVLELAENGFDNTEIPEPAETSGLDYAKLQTFLRVSPSAVAQDARVPLLMNYYLGEDILSASQTKVCRLEFNLLNAEVTLPPTLVKILKLLDNTEHLTFGMTEKGLVFTDGKVTILGLDVAGDKPKIIEQMRAYSDRTDCASQILFKKGEMVSVLNRMALFVTERDGFAVRLSLADGQLIVSTRDRKSSEAVEMSAVTEKIETEWQAVVNIDYLSDVLKALPDDEVVLGFGADDVIQLIANGCKMVLALIRE